MRAIGCDNHATHGTVIDDFYREKTLLFTYVAGLYPSGPLVIRRRCTRFDSVSLMLVAFIWSSSDAIISPCLRGPALRCSSSFDSLGERNNPAVVGVAGVAGVGAAIPENANRLFTSSRMMRSSRISNMVGRPLGWRCSLGLIYSAMSASPK